MHSMPPRITEKSYRLRVSNRTMVGVLEPPRFACVASGPKASNHRIMKPSSRHRRLPWSVRSTSRTQSLSRYRLGWMPIATSIFSRRGRGEYFPLTSPLIGLIDALVYFRLTGGWRRYAQGQQRSAYALDLNGSETRFPTRPICPDCPKTLYKFDIRFPASPSFTSYPIAC
jgi:hypothetical protein